MRRAVLRVSGLGAVLAVLWGCRSAAPTSHADGVAPAAAGALASAGLDAPAAPPPAACRVVPEPELESALGAALPARLGGFCLDAHARLRVYGEGAPEPLERACARVLGPGCEEQPGLQRVVVSHYRDQRGGPATLELIVSAFADVDAAYANFTERWIGERDPLQIGARVLEGPGLGVLEGERAEGWFGRFVAVVLHGDAAAPAAERAGAAAAQLPGALRQVLAALPGEPALPLAVQKLPAAHQVPLGARLLLGDSLGIPGLGAGALGYYRQGEKRWRVLAVVRSDSESARDVLGTLSQNPAVRPIRNAPFPAFAWTERRLPREPQVGWVVGQRQEVVYGVGDEATALPELTSAEREAAVKLSLAEKLVELTRTHTE